MKLYLESSLVADDLASRLDSSTKAIYAAIGFGLLSEALTIYEETAAHANVQFRCIQMIIGTLLSFKEISDENYEGLITRTTQFAAKVFKKNEQCQLVALCAYLFYPIGKPYSNPQRALECLQRALKLADACTTSNPSHTRLFVELLDHYIYFLENGNPLITPAYISGLLALINEHMRSLEYSDERGLSEMKSHFLGTIQYIKDRKADPGTAEIFGPIQMESMGL